MPSNRSPPARDTTDLRRLATWLDEAFTIPGTRYRIGWDGVLGLVPGIGDVLAAIPASYIVLRALALGVPYSVAGRMVANILLEAVVGAIPIVGDLFDFVWKANRRNVRLLERYQHDPGGTRLRSAGMLVVASVAVILVLVAVVAIPIVILAALIDAFGIGSA